MRSRSLGLRAASALAVLLCPAVARAQNNTALSASTLQVGEGWFNVNLDAGTNTERWYKYAVVQGRSYCVEGVSDETPTTPDTLSNDGETNVFRGDRTTLIYRNDDQTEPGGGSNFLSRFPGRVCYIAPATEFNFAKFVTFFPAIKSLRWRIVETTIFCPWFFSGSGFDAFVLIRNTTNQPTLATVTLRNTLGVVLGTRTGTVPANGSFNLLVSDPAGFNLPSASGSVEIAFGSPAMAGMSTPAAANGPPGGLIANLTSLNFGTGVSFDTPFGPRADWTR